MLMGAKGPNGRLPPDRSPASGVGPSGQEIGSYRAFYAVNL